MFCIITGASRGLGRELAKLFAKNKYNLMLNCKNNIDLLNDLKNELENKYNIKVIIKKGHFDNNDFYNIDDLQYVINNASIADYNLLQDVSLDRYKEIIDSNLTDCFLTTKYSIPLLLKKKDGLIINISSTWGDVGSSMEVLYSMTKGGIITFTKALSKELSLSNIDCICFKLGYIDTDMNNNLSIEEKKEIIDNLNDKKMIDKTYISNKIYDIITKHLYKSGDIIDFSNGLEKL